MSKTYSPSKYYRNLKFWVLAHGLIVLSETKNDKGEVTKFRVCLDPCDLRKWAKSEHYSSKTVDEVVSKLKAAKFFTIVDA